MLNNIQNIQFTRPISFTGPLDGGLTNVLRTLDTNPMANAVGIDLFAMVAPRTYVDTRERNKYAGAETFFREFTGTLIVCLSAAYFAKGIAKISSKLIKPNIKINPNSWYSNDSLTYLQKAWQRSGKTSRFVGDVLDSISGRDGNIIKEFKNINFENLEFIEEKKWSKLSGDNPKFKNIHTKLRDKKSITDLVGELIDNKEISKKDFKKIMNILEVRLTNVLGADKITAELSGDKVSSTISNLLRDTVDFGRNIATNPQVNISDAVDKILKINKIKSIGALALSSSLGLTNQYINRKITEKRTGTKGFVGDSDYENQVENKKSSGDKSKTFLLQKIGASLGMVAMAIAVMKVKSPKDFVKKLEFTGPITGGNAIKTVYASTLIGRFLASDSKDELVETVTRDYLGFLNWLVFGGFAAKGVANLLDRKRQNLFNISKDGKGLKNWLNNISLKSHNEIAAKGSEFAKKNMWKLNLAHVAGLGYSTLALGFLLPKLNILINKSRNKNV